MTIRVFSPQHQQNLLKNKQIKNLRMEIDVVLVLPYNVLQWPKVTDLVHTFLLRHSMVGVCLHMELPLFFCYFGQGLLRFEGPGPACPRNSCTALGPLNLRCTWIFPLAGTGPSNLQEPQKLPKVHLWKRGTCWPLSHKINGQDKGQHLFHPMEWITS